MVSWKECKLIADGDAKGKREAKRKLCRQVKVDLSHIYDVLKASERKAERKAVSHVRGVLKEN